MKTICYSIALCLAVLIATTSCTPEKTPNTNKEQIQANGDGNTEPQIPDPEPNP